MGDSTDARAQDLIGRRSILAGAAGVAAFSASGTAAAAAQDNASLSQSSFQPSALPIAEGPTSYQSILTRFAELMSLPNEPPSNATATIANPIDSGADALLRPYANSAVTLSPFDVEYLIQTLSDHIQSCLELRQRGQDVEVLAVNTALLTLYEQDVLRAASAAVANMNSNRHRILGETLDARYSSNDGTISGRPATDKFFTERAQVDEAYIVAKTNDLRRRREALAQPGGGFNYGERFALTKVLFELELKEAYQRARAAAVGLRHIYEIDRPVPQPTATGYLNALAEWTRGSVYELERRMLRRTESTVIFALAPPADPANARFPSPMTRANFDAARTSGIFRFNISEAMLASRPYSLRKPRIRGVDIAFWGGQRSDPSNWGPNAAEVKLAEQKIASPSGGTVYQETPRAIIAPVEFLGRREQRVADTQSLHNFSPIGDWEIDVGLHNVVGTDIRNDNQLSNVLVLLKITHDR